MNSLILFIIFIYLFIYRFLPLSNFITFYIISPQREMLTSFGDRTAVMKIILITINSIIFILCMYNVSHYFWFVSLKKWKKLALKNQRILTLILAVNLKKKRSNSCFFYFKFIFRKRKPNIIFGLPSFIFRLLFCSPFLHAEWHL